jgi:hypothetical protein
VDENEAKQMLINPYYAINLDPGLIEHHPPIVDRRQWRETNKRLIDELGSDEWLSRLLRVLEGSRPRDPDQFARTDG